MTTIPIPATMHGQATRKAAVGLRISDAERQELARCLGPKWELVDIRDAPDSTEMVLVAPCSPQLVAGLRRDFPRARVVVMDSLDRSGAAWARRHCADLLLDGRAA